MGEMACLKPIKMLFLSHKDDILVVKADGLEKPFKDIDIKLENNISFHIGKSILKAINQPCCACQVWTSKFSYQLLLV